jgi:hypothetical protein
MANTIAGKTGIETKKIKLILDKLLIANDGKRVILTKEKIAAIIAEATAETGANTVRGTAITLQTILNALTGQYGKLLMAIGWVAIIGSIVVIVKLLDALVVTQKEANTAIDEAN